MSLRLLFCATAGAIFLGASAEAAVDVSVDPGVSYSTSGLTRYSTFGSNMVGTSVTAHFDDGSFQTINWGSSGALGSSWSLNENGDTFGSLWNLRNSTSRRMRRLVIDGAPGDTVFDTAVNSSGQVVSGYSGTVAGSAGSENGWTFQTFSRPSRLSVRATYRNRLRIGNSPAFGDLWTTLDLEFTNDEGLDSGNELSFIADTDNAAVRGDILPDERFPQEAELPSELISTPEPGSLLLLGGMMLVGLAGGSIRRRKPAHIPDTV